MSPQEPNRHSVVPHIMRGFFEWGTTRKDGNVKIAPRAFLRESYEAKKKEVLDAMMAQLENLIFETVREVAVN